MASAGELKCGERGDLVVGAKEATRVQEDQLEARHVMQR